VTCISNPVTARIQSVKFVSASASGTRLCFPRDDPFAYSIPIDMRTYTQFHLRANAALSKDTPISIREFLCIQEGDTTTTLSLECVVARIQPPHPDHTDNRWRVYCCDDGIERDEIFLELDDNEFQMLPIGIVPNATVRLWRVCRILNRGERLVYCKLLPEISYIEVTRPPDLSIDISRQSG